MRTCPSKLGSYRDEICFGHGLVLVEVFLIWTKMDKRSHMLLFICPD